MNDINDNGNACVSNNENQLLQLLSSIDFKLTDEDLNIFIDRNPQYSKEYFIRIFEKFKSLVKLTESEESHLNIFSKFLVAR